MVSLFYIKNTLKVILKEIFIKLNQKYPEKV